MRRKEAGFTLIELLTVVAIGIVTLTIGVPTFQSALQRVRVDTTLHVLTADMATARGTAVMRRAPVVVCPRDAASRCSERQDWSRGWMVFEDADGDRQPNRSEDIIRLTDAPSGDSAILYLPSTRPFLRYKPDGRSAHTNLTVYLCSPRGLVGSAVVNNLGRVRTSREDGGEPCPRA